MKKLIITSIALFFICNHLAFGQKTLEEYVEKYGRDKIYKTIGYDAFTVPATSKSFRDGHGKNPYFTSKEQLPDTIALIAFNIRDLGDVEVQEAGIYIITTYRHLSEHGGNMISNNIYDLSIDMLKARFKEEGVVLLTPKEFLNTQEKIDYYYDEFEPDVSKLGSFLSKVENKGTQMSTSADYFRTFDLGAANDWRRSVSLGSDLANKLEVDAVLSIGTAFRSDRKELSMRYVAMALHGPNLISKEDKKYAAQKAGNGYNEGQLYTGLNYIIKNEMKVASIHKEGIYDINFKGIEVIIEEMVNRMYDFQYSAIEKTQK